MGLFPSILRRGDEKKVPGPGDDFWYSMPGFPSLSGVRVSEREAMQYLTVASCVQLVAGDIARLPLILYRRRKDSGKERAVDHPLYDILHSAVSEECGSFHWRETEQGHLMLWGNAYSLIYRNGKGVVTALRQIAEPSSVEVRRGSSGQLLYTFPAADGNRATVRADEMFHVAGYGYNGLVGMSCIEFARQSIGLGVAAEAFGAKYFGEGTHPAGVLSMDGTLGTDEQRKAYLKSLREGYAGLGKAHKIMVVEHGLKYSPLTIPMDDAQFLETREFQKKEICGFYHVPPHKIGVHGSNSNYNNLEQENQSYVDSCLMHWIARWESSISRQLLTPSERKAGLFAEFLVEGLLRGDSAARADYYTKMFATGSICPNDIRGKENMNPIDGGDQYFVPLNYISLKDAGRLSDNAGGGGDAGGAIGSRADWDEMAIRGFWRGDIARRSIYIRDRIAARFGPLILEAAAAVVDREVSAIKKRVAPRAVDDDLEGFLRDFYATFPAYVGMKMGPVLRAYMAAVIDQTVDELGVDAGAYDDEIRKYVEKYAERHTQASLGQMIALLEEEDGAAAVETRADEWAEKRPEKIRTDETVRASSAAYSFVAFGAGLAIYWRVRGENTCPYCKQLSGRKIRSGEAFVEAGGEVDPKDGMSDTMKVWGKKMHPPLHAGCDCYISA